MLNKEISSLICQLLTTIALGEQDLEVLRIFLCEDTDFYPLGIFNHISKQIPGAI